MKITPSLLSIPPYLSTSWSNIASLQTRPSAGAFTLIVSLKGGSTIEVPGLDATAVEEIFAAHARYAAEQTSLFPFPLPLSQDGQVGPLSDAMQHNPEQTGMPPLPPQILDRIATVAKAFGLDDTAILNAPEPDCGCLYCQVVRALHKEEAPQEEVSAADLQFRDWDVAQTGDKLYFVTNPLDPNERYQVFLGQPLGCTCGQKNCEHVKAVLNS
jgi:hypothetical protein